MGSFFGRLGQWRRAGWLSQYLLLIACVAGIAGLLLTARALVALSPVAAVVAALLNPQVRAAVPAWLRNKAAQRLAVLYLLVPLTCWYTQDWPTWRHEMYRQLPLIGVPLAFGLAVPLARWQRFGIGVLFVCGTAAVGLATLGKYLSDPDTALALISVGQNVPSVTRIFHIHFGILLALATYFGYWLGREPLAGRAGRWALWLAAAACFLSLHLLAYRTGLMAFYLALVVSALATARRHPWRVGGGLVLGLALAVGAYQLKTVDVRVSNTFYDLERYQLGQDINDLSLSKRLAAWQTAAAIVRAQPVLGVAPADVRQAMMQQYDRHDFGLRPENRVMVHNQYLHYLVGAGIMGLLLWLWVLFAPFMKPGLRRDAYVRHFLLVFAAAALADSLLELQIGFNLFVFLYGFLVVAVERDTQSSPASC